MPPVCRVPPADLQRRDGDGVAHARHAHDLAGVLPALAAVGLALGATWQTYRRWQNHVRWRPWLWLTQLMWIGASAYLLLIGSALVAQPPQG